MPRLTALRRPARRRPPTRFAWATRRRLTIAAATVGSVALLASAIFFAGRLGAGEWIADATDDVGRMALRATARAGLSVTEILVSGRHHTPDAQVIAAVDVKLGAPLLSFSPAAAKAELERLPWVKRADVERHFPGSVVVRLIEREPLALWQTRGAFSVIDADGHEIRSIDPGLFRHLTTVVGDDAPRHAHSLLALLATEPELKKRVTAAVRMAHRRWDLLLDNDIRVQLPEHDTGMAWAKLANAERTERLLDRNVTHVDLRAQDRITVRIAPAPTAPPPTAPARVRAGSRPT